MSVAYYTCPECGAHLDSQSERCDCSDGVEALSVRACCPYFMERFDIGAKSGIRCRLRDAIAPGDICHDLPDRTTRDAYYTRMCCDRYQGCAIYATVAPRR